MYCGSNKVNFDLTEPKWLQIAHHDEPRRLGQQNPAGVYRGLESQMCKAL